MKAVCIKKIFLVVLMVNIYFAGSKAFSFVLLSGPEEAKLDVSPDQPTALFHWDGSAPNLESLEDFNDGVLMGS